MKETERGRGEKQRVRGKIITVRAAARVIIQAQGWIEAFLEERRNRRKYRVSTQEGIGSARPLSLGSYSKLIHMGAFLEVIVIRPEPLVWNINITTLT
jgi:hypothetical protein